MSFIYSFICTGKATILIYGIKEQHIQVIAGTLRELNAVMQNPVQSLIQGHGCLFIHMLSSGIVKVDDVKDFPLYSANALCFNLKNQYIMKFRRYIEQQRRQYQASRATEIQLTSQTTQNQITPSWM